MNANDAMGFSGGLNFLVDGHFWCASQYIAADIRSDKIKIELILSCMRAGCMQTKIDRNCVYIMSENDVRVCRIDLNTYIFSAIVFSKFYHKMLCSIRIHKIKLRMLLLLRNAQFFFLHFYLLVFAITNFKFVVLFHFYR